MKQTTLDSALENEKRIAELVIRKKGLRAKPTEKEAPEVPPTSYLGPTSSV